MKYSIIVFFFIYSIFYDAISHRKMEKELTQTIVPKKKLSPPFVISHTYVWFFVVLHKAKIKFSLILSPSLLRNVRIVPHINRILNF